jgi:hypothetical protein
MIILLIGFQASILVQLDTPHKPKTKVASTVSFQCWIFYKSHTKCGPLVKAHFNLESFCTYVTSSDVLVPAPCNARSCAHLHSVYEVLYMRSSVLSLARLSISKLNSGDGRQMEYWWTYNWQDKTIILEHKPIPRPLLPQQNLRGLPGKELRLPRWDSHQPSEFGVGSYGVRVSFV